MGHTDIILMIFQYVLLPLLLDISLFTKKKKKKKKKEEEVDISLFGLVN